jgi:elongation factor G
MDRVGADFDNVVEMIEDRFGSRPVPIQIPIGAEAGFEGVVDLLTERALYWDDETLGAEIREADIPSSLTERARAARERMVEAAAEFDEDLLTQYVEGKTVSAGPLRSALRAGTLGLKIVPVLCGSAFKNKGVQTLLDAVVDLLPSPMDVPPVEGVQPKTGETVTRAADDDAPFAALVFKLMTDKHVGHLSYIRVYSGTSRTGEAVLNTASGRKQRMGRLLQMHANKRQEIEEICTGDIVAVVGLKDVKTGQTLCAVNKPVILEDLNFPDPVISIAIEPKTQADMDRMSQSLDRLVQEDPTFRVTSDSETGQTLISGMGELHLEIITDRLLREFGVQANVGRPQVAYKETITRAVDVEGRYVKQTGGSGDFAVVKLRVSPGEPGSGFEFVSSVKGGAVPKEYIAAVQQGCVEAAEGGALGGYPTVDLRVELLDGQTHEVDSSERSFKIAGSMATREALEKGNPTVLEPIMSVEVVTPEGFVGAVQGDLSGRRGQLTGIEVRSGAQVLAAEAPLASMFGYVNNLRSMTQGRASYTMQFSHYAPVPDAVIDALVAR